MRELDVANIPPLEKVQLQATLADAYAKFSKAFSRVNPALGGLAIALDTLKVITEYLRDNDPMALRYFHAHIEQIGGLLGTKHGK